MFGSCNLGRLPYTSSLGRVRLAVYVPMSTESKNELKAPNLLNPKPLNPIPQALNPEPQNPSPLNRKL